MEIATEAKTLIIEMTCNKCGKGIMQDISGNVVLCTYPPQYLHKCNNCGYEETYNVSYPYQKFVPVEPLKKENKTDETEKLKRCPFCGEEAELKEIKGFDRQVVSAYVFCQNCEASTRNYATPNVAIEAWNRRCYE